MKKVNGYILHKRVLKQLEPEKEPETKEEAIKYVAWLEYLVANPPTLITHDLKKHEEWEEENIKEINELKDKFGLWELKQK